MAAVRSADRPAGERPARSFGDKANPAPAVTRWVSESKTYGKPKTRPDGKPYPKRDGAAPARGPKPGGYGKPAGGRSPSAAGRPAVPAKARHQGLLPSGPLAGPKP